MPRDEEWAMSTLPGQRSILNMIWVADHCRLLCSLAYLPCRRWQLHTYCAVCSGSSPSLPLLPCEKRIPIGVPPSASSPSGGNNQKEKRIYEFSSWAPRLNLGSPSCILLVNVQALYWSPASWMQLSSPLQGFQQLYRRSTHWLSYLAIMTIVVYHVWRCTRVKEFVVCRGMPLCTSSNGLRFRHLKDCFLQYHPTPDFRSAWKPFLWSHR